MSIVEIAVEAFPALMEGLGMTIFLTVISIIFGTILGIFLALGKTYGPRYIRMLTTGFIGIIRGTPLLAQLFILYFGLPPYGIRLSAVTVALIGFTINSGAYQAEYLRGSIQSISSGQMRSALSVGMTKWQAIFYVILPQALRRFIPACTNEFVYLLKYTSLAYMIGTPELMGQAKFIASRNYEFFKVYLIVAFIYFVVVMIITEILGRVEDRVRIPGFEYHK